MLRELELIERDGVAVVGVAKDENRLAVDGKAKLGGGLAVVVAIDGIKPGLKIDLTAESVLCHRT